MIRPLVTIESIGAGVLTRPSEPVRRFDSDLHRLIQDLWDTMYGNSGMGLAACQIGTPFQVIVVDPYNRREPDARLVLINPVITYATGEQIGEEGCLSIPGHLRRVARPYRITVEYHGRYGVYRKLVTEGLKARVLAHEIDHCNGRLITDHPVPPLPPDDSAA